MDNAVHPSAPSNLPLALTSFIGRERDLEQVKDLLRQTRLVTLTGTGGVGKTRLALEVARQVVEDYPDGIWLVELAALADPTLVPHAVAGVLGVTDQPSQPITATLVAALRSRRLLLALDNCEHLVAACAALADGLLRSCPRVRILATSREALNITGERVWRVPSLAVPDGSRLPPLDAFTQIEAVRLFAERAVLAQARFAVTARNAPAVAQVCDRLDGIPLAIELAAARVNALTVDQIAARLDDRFRLLTGGSRTALPRQQTLRATLDWGYDLLPEAERVLLRRLAVFAGGWTLEAGEAIGGGEPIATADVLDRLAGLVVKSFVRMDEQGGEARYWLLETVRQYAGERLTVAGEAVVMRDRHRDWYVALAEQAEPALEGRVAGYHTWLCRLDTEHDNLRTALAWSLDSDTLAGLRLAGSMAEFWRVRRRQGEGARWLEDLLARAPGRTIVQARALFGAGRLYREAGDLPKARSLLSEALTRCEELGDRWGMAHTLLRLGLMAAADGDEERARALHERSMALGRELGDGFGLALALNTRANLAIRQGDYGRARALLAEGTTYLRALGRTDRLWAAVCKRAVVARLEGDYGWARVLLDEGQMLVETARVKDPFPPVLVQILRGDLARSEGDERQARALYAAALVQCQTLTGGSLVAHILSLFGVLAVQHGAPARGVRLLAAVTGGASLPGDGDRPEAPREREAALAAARATLGEAAFAAAWAAGQEMTLEQAVGVALGEGAASPPAPTPARRLPLDGPEALTAREVEIVGLVARGLTNAAIAAQLDIAERTARTHVSNILGKLGLANRAQLAVWAVAQGLAPVSLAE